MRRVADRRQRGTRGLTLVETMVAVALGTIIIGIVISTSIQVQRAIGIAQARELMTRQVRAFYSDMELDLARIVPFSTPPAPFLATDAPITMLHTDSGVQTGDPAGLDRFADQITMLSSLPDSSRMVADATTNEQRPVNVHAVVQYNLQTTGTGGMVSYSSDPQGGVKTARLTRTILRQALIQPAAALEPPWPPGYAPKTPVAFVDNVLSFQLEYLDWKPTVSDTFDHNVFMAPSPVAGEGPSDRTDNGQRWITSAQVQIVAGGGISNDFAISCTDPTFLAGIPIGGPISLVLQPIPPPPNSPPPPTPTTFLVRKYFRVDGNGRPTTVLLTDRPDVPSGSTVAAAAVVLPTMVRATLIVAFGKGPDAETARFTREMPVSR